MNKHLAAQLEKVLALVDSNHDAEALVAVRKAREMLLRDGLSFGDLARAAVQKPRMNFPLGFFSGQHIANLENEILELRQQLEDLRTQKAIHEGHATTWKTRVNELEHKLTQSQNEATRWRQLARETVEKLWDLGQSMQQDDPVIQALEDVQSA